MINDVLLKVADQDLAPVDYDGGAVVSSKSIDLQSARDIGEGENLYMLFNIDVAVTSSAAYTMQFQIITADNADLTGNVKILNQSDAISKATLVAGYYFPLQIPPNIGTKGQRYLGVQVTPGGAADATAGKYTAQVIKNIEDAKGKEYPSGFSIS